MTLSYKEMVSVFISDSSELQIKKVKRPGLKRAFETFFFARDILKCFPNINSVLGMFDVKYKDIFLQYQSAFEK